MVTAQCNAIFCQVFWNESKIYWSPGEQKECLSTQQHLHILKRNYLFTLDVKLKKKINSLSPSLGFLTKQGQKRTVLIPGTQKQPQVLKLENPDSYAN